VAGPGVPGGGGESPDRRRQTPDVHELGTFRIRPRGSSGGHNGLRSIAGRLQSEDYARLRIGIGPRPEDEEGVDFLLSAFEDDERRTVDDLMSAMTEAVECWIREGVETAMNRYNRRGNGT
jgi:PTH1 family peptidyl-tRNA hydrolase